MIINYDRQANVKLKIFDQFMQRLVELITHRLSFIINYQNGNLLKNTESPLILLLKEKKRQLFNQGVETSLIRTIIERRITDPYLIQQFYEKSLHLMKIYDTNFSIKQLSTQPNIYDQTVKAYITFFNKQGSKVRAQEVHHLYRKNICTKSELISTLLVWFADWAKKTFIAFLKEQLIKQGILKNKQTLNTENKKSSLALNFSLLPIQKVYHCQNSVSIENIQQVVSLPKKSKVILQKDISFQSEKQLQEKLNFKMQIRKKSSLEWPKDQNLFVNREVFLGAFIDEIQYYYKQLNDVLDVDVNFIRMIKRNDKKQQLSNKLPQIAGLLSKYQGQCKKKIDQYYKDYHSRFDTLLKNKALKLKIQHQTQKKIRSELKNSYQLARQPKRQRYKNDLDKSLEYINSNHQTIEKRQYYHSQSKNNKYQLQQLKRMSGGKVVKQFSYTNIELEMPQQCNSVNQMLGKVHYEKGQLKIHQNMNQGDYSIKLKQSKGQKRPNFVSIRKNLSKARIRQLQKYIYKQKQSEDFSGIFYLPKINK